MNFKLRERKTKVTNFKFFFFFVFVQVNNRFSCCSEIMQPQRKKNKSNKPKFTNCDDENQYHQITIILDKELNQYKKLQIPIAIIEEISEYSTGNFSKCTGELDNGDCDGYIHYLHGDNFSGNNIGYAWKLFKYECDNIKCRKVSHILTCSECKDIIQIEEQSSPYPYFICENALRLNPSCRNIFCGKHCDKNGVCCEACSVYYCCDCEKQYGSHCLNCDEYWCKQHKDECLENSDYCDYCLSVSSGLYNDNINDPRLYE